MSEKQRIASMTRLPASSYPDRMNESMYEILYQKIFNPAYERYVKKRRIIGHREFLLKSQWWPAEKIRAYQEQELRKLLRAANGSAWWRQRLAEAGVNPETADHAALLRIPVMTKADIRAHKAEMIPAQWRGLTWTKSTGGSTGVPLELDYTPDSYDWRVACMQRGYSWAHCVDGRKQAYIWGAAIGEPTAAEKRKAALHNAVLRRKVYNCFEFTEDKMAACLNELNQFKPDSLVGYTNPMYNFAKFVGSRDKVKFTLRGIISAAEKLHAYQRELIQEVFGCPVYNTYGSREFMLIASESVPGDGLLINAENLIVETVRDNGAPCAPGESGRLVITDLHNHGMPFIRYEIGDLGILSDKPASCGRGLPVLADVVGRSLDMIFTPDGRQVPGEFFPHLMKEFRAIKQFQVIQDTLERLEIKIVQASPLTDEELAFMRKEIQKVMGNTIQVNINFVEEIPLTRTGKFRVTVCNIVKSEV